MRDPATHPDTLRHIWNANVTWSRDWELVRAIATHLNAPHEVFYELAKNGDVSSELRLAASNPSLPPAAAELIHNRVAPHLEVAEHLMQNKKAPALFRQSIDSWGRQLHRGSSI